MRAVFGEIDPEEQPAKYASFVSKVLEQALREESDSEKRLALCNFILGHVASEPGRSHREKNRLISHQKPILLEITPPNYGTSGIPRPILRWQTGAGMFHFAEAKTYALLVTFQKTEKEFSPSTMYADYPISRNLLHWESQTNTAQHHNDGQNLIHQVERGYTILVFARGQKKRNDVTVPFTYLGPVERVRFESERPIKVVWRLRHQMSVEMFEDNRRRG